MPSRAAAGEREREPGQDHAGEVEPVGGVRRRLLDDRDERCRLAAAGRRRVVEEFSLEVNIERMWTALSFVLGREAIDKPEGDILVSELLPLTGLHAVGKGISNLQGLEHCTGLIELSLQQNSIQDISPLALLENLSSVYLWENQIVDLSPLVENPPYSSSSIQ